MADRIELEPLTDDERRNLPIFPLPRVVLFPGAILPLHIFEPRYRALMEDCVKNGPMAMAVALLTPGWEDDYEGNPSIHEIAGAGRICDWRRREDGRFDFILYGTERVRLDELDMADRSYRRARATRVDDRISHLHAVEQLQPRVLTTASTLVAMVRKEHPEFELDLAADSPPGVVADRIADRLVPDVAVRQRILETSDVKVRLALVQDALIELLAKLGADRPGPLH